jgi:hypothetical protein
MPANVGASWPTETLFQTRNIEPVTLSAIDHFALANRRDVLLKKVKFLKETDPIPRVDW